MSFTPIETSNDLGQPILLYAFMIGAAAFRYTSADSDIVIGGYKWKATAISNDGIKQSGDATVDTLTVSAPSSIAPVGLFQGTPPSTSIRLVISALHADDTEAITMYSGQVVECNFPQPGTATFSCDAMALTMERAGLRLAWQRNCPFALYDQGTCKVDKSAFAIPMTVLQPVSGDKINVQGLDAIGDGVLNGGFIQWDHPQRGREYRMVEDQTAAVLTMFGLADGLYYGLSIIGYPGCNRTTSDCAEKFNNLDNYGGIPDLPGKSPFDGDPVF